MQKPSFWSRTISTSTARGHSTKPFRPPKPGGWSSASNGTTLQSTAVGSIWRSPNSASYPPSASTAGFPTNKLSSRKSQPGSTTVIPTTPRPTGTSQPPMHVSNSSISTLHSHSIGRIETAIVLLGQGMENVSIVDEKGRVFSAQEFSLFDNDDD